MANKVRDLFLKNLIFKLLALLFAILLWWMVTSVSDPTQYKSFSVSVTMQNESALTAAGKYYTVLKNSDTVSVRVTAKRSVIDRLSSADFTATADLSRIENNSQVPVEIKINRYANQVSVGAKNYYVDVKVTNARTTQFTIEAKTTGNLADGYALGEVKSDPGVVTVTGPEDVVSSIAAVEANLDVSKANRKLSKSVALKYLDKSGEAVDTTNLTTSVQSVDVSAEVFATKTVPVTVNQSESPANGLKLVSVTVSPQSIQIMGNATDLNKVTEITIPASAVNLSKITATSDISVDISSYLPSGIKPVDPNQSKVTVIVTLEGQVTRQFDIPTANLTIQKLPSGCQGKFESQTVTVSITGSGSEINELQAENITGSVDASGLTAGSHTVRVKLNLKEDLLTPETTTRLTVSSQ